VALEYLKFTEYITLNTELHLYRLASQSQILHYLLLIINKIDIVITLAMTLGLHVVHFSRCRQLP